MRLNETAPVTETPQNSPVLSRRAFLATLASIGSVLACDTPMPTSETVKIITTEHSLLREEKQSIEERVRANSGPLPQQLRQEIITFNTKIPTHNESLLRGGFNSETTGEQRLMPIGPIDLQALRSK